MLSKSFRISGCFAIWMSIIHLRTKTTSVPSQKDGSSSTIQFLNVAPLLLSVGWWGGWFGCLRKLWKTTVLYMLRYVTVLLATFSVRGYMTCAVGTLLFTMTSEKMSLAVAWGVAYLGEEVWLRCFPLYVISFVGLFETESNLAMPCAPLDRDCYKAYSTRAFSAFSGTGRKRFGDDHLGSSLPYAASRARSCLSTLYKTQTIKENDVFRKST